MSITTGDFRQRVTVQTLAEKKHNHEPIVCLTAYDYSAARLADEAGVDLVLVGDSLAQVVLGYDSTLPVTMEEMLHHTRATRRASSGLSWWPTCPLAAITPVSGRPWKTPCAL